MEAKAALVKIASTGFWASAVSYAVFWIADAMRPGFTARYISVHVFLLSAILLGVWGGFEKHRERPLMLWMLAIGLGILVAVVGWSIGEGFEEYRVLVSMIGLFVPSICLALLRSTLR